MEVLGPTSLGKRRQIRFVGSVAIAFFLYPVPKYDVLTIKQKKKKEETTLFADFHSTWRHEKILIIVLNFFFRKDFPFRPVLLINLNT